MKPEIGIHINDGGQRFTDLILSGQKTVETRFPRKNNPEKGTLDKFVGQRVGLIRTGRGPAMLVGYATIGERITYSSLAEFRAAESEHQVEAGSNYDTQGKKFGYSLLDVERVTPTVVPRGGDRISRPLARPEVEVSLSGRGRAVSVGKDRAARTI